MANKSVRSYVSSEIVSPSCGERKSSGTTHTDCGMLVARSGYCYTRHCSAAILVNMFFGARTGRVFLLLGERRDSNHAWFEGRMLRTRQISVAEADCRIYTSRKQTDDGHNKVI